MEPGLRPRPSGPIAAVSRTLVHALTLVYALTLVVALAVPRSPGLAAAPTPRQPVVEWDERAGAYADRRMTVARLQSDLERVAAGRAPWPLPAGQQADPLDAIIEAYAGFLAGDFPAMDQALARIARETSRRRPPPPSASGTDWQRRRAEQSERFFGALAHPARSPVPLTRLLAGLRRVDSVLFAEAAAFYGVDLAARTVPMRARPPSAVDGTWLRLPCRTVVGRAAEFAAAATALGPRGGPLLACPAAPSVPPARLAALALDPAAFPPADTPAPVVETDRESDLRISGDHLLAAALAGSAAVDSRDRLGRTALMIAAERDRPDSAARLLAAGARINATTWQDGDPFRVVLAHDGRTALHYAAANASLDMIRRLLAAGADPSQADTKGRRAVDYLLGFGPTPPNPTLSPGDRSTAARLLF